MLNSPVGDVQQRSTVVKQNPDTVEQLFNSVQQPTTPQERAAQASKPVSLLSAHRQQRTATQDAEEGIRADGARWLTTTQAWERAAERGYQGTKAAFRGWSERNPDDLALWYELGRTGYSGKSNAMASFEDLRAGAE